MENIYELYTTDQVNMIHNSDLYTIFYAILSQTMIDELGVEGDAIAREATRRYGTDRGKTRRDVQLDANYKINMKDLFSVGSDLPPDPRFRRDRRRLVPEERNSHTLRCPMSEIWKREGYQKVGRMYCEEFHPACYKSYAFGYTKVGLAKTLTQTGDDYCSFNIVLRQEDLPDELKPVCFEEYDPYYTGPTKTIPVPTAKKGFNSLTVRVYYYFYETAAEYQGEKGLEALKKGLERFAAWQGDYLKKAAKKMNCEMTADFVDKNMPFYWNIDEDEMLPGYDRNGAKDFLLRNYYPAMKECFGL